MINNNTTSPNQPGEPLPQPGVKENKTVIAVVTSVILTAVIVGAGVYAWQYSANQQVQADKAALEQRVAVLEEQAKPTPAPTTTASDKGEYRNPELGFQLTLPTGWEVLPSSLGGRDFYFTSPGDNPSCTGSFCDVHLRVENVELDAQTSKSASLEPVQNIVINGINWERSVFDDSGAVKVGNVGVERFRQFKTTHKNLVYVFSIPDSEEAERQLKEAFSTFMWLDSSPL